MPNPHSLQSILPGLLGKLKPAELEALHADWLLWARDEQLPPEDDNWTSWIFLGGRGAGKTRAGAEWVRALALGLPPFADEPYGRIALIGETFNDVREVMVEGVSGVLAVHPRSQRPTFEKSRNRLVWPNGAIAQLFSAEEPDSLRGPQFHAAWCDELAKWRYGQATYDNLQFALRLGQTPRQLITTTPRPLPLLKKLLADPSSVVTHAATRANADNLAPNFLSTITARYDGQRLGRQELDGEMIEDRADALWTREMFDAQRVNALPPLQRIVVAVDPAVTANKNSDACGLIVAGKSGDGHAYILEDATLHRARPDAWAAKAIALYHRHQADALVVETNQGGDVIATVLATIDKTVPVTQVRATRGKWLRAEPVAALYARGFVHHLGLFAKLEDEMCDFGPEGLSGGRSPDRLDALVWALTALQVDAAQPAIRRL